MDITHSHYLDFSLGNPQQTSAEVTALAFDESGRHLAVGIRSGYVTIYRVDESSQKPLYRDFVGFQSHFPEFDYLKSLDIEEKINQLKFLPTATNSMHVLSTNDKTIKLWKVDEGSSPDSSKAQSATYLAERGMDTPPPPPRRLSKIFSRTSSSSSSSSSSEIKSSKQLKLPSSRKHANPSPTAKPKKVFENAHAYHINSISLSSDGETFLSSDDLRINLWNVECMTHAFNIIDMKPENMEELEEVITAASFHPQHSNIFCFSSSKGTVNVIDTRESALGERAVQTFQPAERPPQNFYSEIISSISDVKYSPNGESLVTRDFFTARTWDPRMSNHPITTTALHDNLKSSLRELYESECIFDKFDCCISPDSSVILTGTFNGLFHLVDRHKGQRYSVAVGHALTPWNQPSCPSNPFSPRFHAKALHSAWSPSRDVFAVATGPVVHVYERKLSPLFSM